MSRRDLRFRIGHDGRLEVVDPGFDTLRLMRTVDPSFRIRRQALPGFTRPRFLEMRGAGCGLSHEELGNLPDDRLWDIHGRTLNEWRNGRLSPKGRREEASLLDLKTEIARRILSACRLCGHRCGVNRIEGQVGVCGLGTRSLVAEHFVHIGEEPPINPSLVLSLAGCGLRCRFCQQAENLDPAPPWGEPLEPELWMHLSHKGARSLSFIGGNPDESLYAVLRFLAASPGNWRLPTVWNCNAYGTPETLSILEGVVDVYLPDFKYGHEQCGRELSGAAGYPDAAKTAISAMVSQGVPVIVRILVLPGHLECCHIPALKFLETLSSENLFLSVRGQYCPDWRITSEDGELARRPTFEETEAVRGMAEKLGLTLIRE